MTNIKKINKKGLLIALEGIDGAGKKTWSNILKKQITKKNISVKIFDYPDYKSPWGKIIKKYLYNKIDLNITEQFYTYFIDIIKDQDKIKQYILNGDIVILNRYFSSTVAFQCTKGFPYYKALSIIKAADPLIPDIAFFLDVSPKIAIERCYKRKKPDRHESDLQLLTQVNQFYKKIIKEHILAHKWIIVDANIDLKSMQIIMKDTIDYILNNFIQQNKDI